MGLYIGDIAPNFSIASTMRMIDFHEWLGNSWGILLSHPSDYTPVCTTELGNTAKLKPEFDKRNTKIIAVSVDSMEDHLKWIEDINDTQNTEINFPIIADPKKEIATIYDMIHSKESEVTTVRSVFFISPKKEIKAIITYPMNTGRNFKEIIRVLDSLQLTEKHDVATPADWQQGDDVVIAPTLKDEEIAEKFPKGHTVIKPYLRTTPQPE